MQQEIEQYKMEILKHQEEAKLAAGQQRAAINALITLKEGLIDLKEQQIKEREKEIVLTKPVAYLESVAKLLEKDIATAKIAVETAEPGKKEVLKQSITSKEQLLKEINKSITKRKAEQANAIGSVGNWQQQKEILNESITTQNFVKDRVSPALKKVIDQNNVMKASAINQLDANIIGGTSGSEIKKIGAIDDTFDLLNGNDNFDTSLNEEFALNGTNGETSQNRVQTVAKQIMPEFQQDVFTAKIGVPSESPLSQTISVDNDMAQQLTGQLGTFQSQTVSAIEEQQQNALERINIFKGEARQLKHQEECKKRLAASGCGYQCKKTVRCCH